MTGIIIAGVGQTPVGEHWDMSLRELALQAIQAALADAGGLKPQALFVGNMLAPMVSHQAHLGSLVADFAGLTGIEAATLEASGASGAAALRAGYLAIASGQADVALVLGVEKFTDLVGSKIDQALTVATDSDYEASAGITPTAQAALLMRRYLHEHNPPRSAFGGFALVAHANGESNPNAMFRKAINQETYNRAGLVNDPLNLYDAAPNADGAAALVLVRGDLLPAKTPFPQVRIAGSSLVTDRLALHDRADILSFEAARISVVRACRQAGIEAEHVDFFELCDAYSIYAALSLEAAGFASRGKGWQMAADGDLTLGGSLPIATLGGLKARGNPGGATGIYQVVEAVLQLRGQAGKNQLSNPQRAMVQSLGGPSSTAATYILEALT